MRQIAARKITWHLRPVGRREQRDLWSQDADVLMGLRLREIREVYASAIPHHAGSPRTAKAAIPALLRERERKLSAVVNYR